MNTDNKILLDDRTELANNVLKELNQGYENGRELLKMLSALGLQLDEVTDWSAIESHFTQQFPKATLQFNLEASGIAKAFRAAEAFYIQHKNSLTFAPMTAEEKEMHRESLRIYADTPRTIEIHGLLMQTIDNLNRLKELDAKMNFGTLYNAHRIFTLSDAGKFEKDKRQIIDFLTSRR